MMEYGGGWLRLFSRFAEVWGNDERESSEKLCKSKGIRKRVAGDAQLVIL